MNKIKAIETFYNGYKFRSRLEARWAVFFDYCNIKWEYEAEGFTAEDGTCYLPDFYLPDFKTYVEVKANTETAKADVERCAKMITWGSPIRRILLLTNIPSGEKHHGLWHFPCLCWNGRRDKVDYGWWSFTDIDYGEVEGELTYYNYYPKFRIEDDGSVHMNNLIYYEGGELKKIINIPFNISPERDCDLVIDNEPPYKPIVDYDKEDADLQYEQNQTVFDGFKKARQARFEFGVKG